MDQKGENEMTKGRKKEMKAGGSLMEGGSLQKYEMERKRIEDKE